MTNVSPLSGALGAALLVVGMVSQLATLFSRRRMWGSTEWEIAYFGEFSATLVITLMGLGLLAGLVVWQGSRVGKVVLAVVLVVLAAWATVGALLVTLDAPLVWQAAQTAGSPAQAAGMKTVTIKAMALCGWYALSLLTLTATLIRSTGTRGR